MNIFNGEIEMTTERKKDLEIKTKSKTHRFKFVQLKGKDQKPSFFTQPKDPGWANKPHIDKKNGTPILHVDRIDFIPRQKDIKNIPIDKLHICCFTNNVTIYQLPNIRMYTEATTSYIGWNQEKKEFKDEYSIEDVRFEMTLSNDGEWRNLRKTSGPSFELIPLYLTERDGRQEIDYDLMNKIRRKDTI
jgi:hypothetical protein